MDFIKMKIWKILYKSLKLLSRYKIPSFQTETFPEVNDFVFIHWVDANSSAEWTEIKKAKKTKLSNCLSTGWLINKNTTEVTVMSDLTWDDDGSIKQQWPPTPHGRERGMSFNEIQDA